MKTTRNNQSETRVILFAKPEDWEEWLKANHAQSSGLWLRLAKKNSGVESLTYGDALDIALCYGWIDGQKKRSDDVTWLQKFTPRGGRSIWSKINWEKAEALINSKRMRPAGLKAIESAKQNGRWDAAYDSQSNATVPDDFQAALDQNAGAKAFFATLKSANRYAILFRIHTAKKAETRSRRIRQFIEMLENHETIHPQS
jgi:uncharacterized protein YdeI (YjbR/CyaY-like superfamily)